MCQGAAVSRLMQLVSGHFPLSADFSHLKRGRKVEGKVQILLSQTDELSDEQKTILSELEIEPTVDAVKVPRYPPRTSEESKLQSLSIWPTIFRRGKNEWNPTPLLKSEVAEIKERAQRLLAAARTSAPVIRVHDRRVGVHDHQGGDQDQDQDQKQEGDSRIFECSKVCQLYLGEHLVAHAEREEDVVDMHLLRHSCLYALQRLGETVVDILGGGRAAKRLRGPHMAALQEVQTSQSVNGVEPDQYYASNCDAYVFGEPCVMCTMGLTHSRIKRLIIVADRSQNWRSSNGGVDTGVSVPLCKALNHHFPVYIATPDNAPTTTPPTASPTPLPATPPPTTPPTSE
ncbi:hypothetical protein GNI_075010 [Gregarina niphandrodes]|uniref:CMP/dCMP-type deaminase domain-containing protein n=1 Tax=Gregarina niphandrodes TaxID=110365 RepID=A0A023B6Z7_GRENI|nr:hypothetical protein GNI_075010 [Gregarina niphandrodes]EZG66841.1 hypothetical protein GNI_075010 [Gregarina niphandrodes]|eukprot:XP_011130463.1 hypothetical protein GNI_075010 [Gregarina niphandrodes]